MEPVEERESNLRLEPQPRRLEMPVFDGTNPEDCVYQVERFFVVNRLSEMEKLEAAVISLDGEAWAWFQWEDGRRPIRTWPELRTNLSDCFRSTQEGMTDERFLALKQGGSARDYCRRNFELLVAPLKEVSELENEKNYPKSWDAPQMFDEKEIVQPVDVILGFDAWKSTFSDGVDGSPSQDLHVIDKIESVDGMLRRNSALAEFATVQHLLEVWEDRIDKMAPPMDPGDETFDEIAPPADPVDPGELLGRLKENASYDAKPFKSSSENDGGFRAAGEGHMLSYDGEVDHLNRRSQFVLRKGSYQRMYFQQGTEAEESWSAEKCFMSQADDERVDAYHRSSSLLSTVVAKKLMSLLAVGQLGNTYHLHGKPKLKFSRELRTKLARSDYSEGHRLRFKKLDVHILSSESVASVLVEVCEECEELLIEAGRKHRSALSIDGNDVKALYYWDLALLFRAQLIADILEASFDAGQVYLAATNKIDAKESRDTVYAPQMLDEMPDGSMSGIPGLNQTSNNLTLKGNANLGNGLEPLQKANQVQQYVCTQILVFNSILSGWKQDSYSDDMPGRPGSLTISLIGDSNVDDAAAHLVVSTTHCCQFQKVLTAIGKFYNCSQSDIANADFCYNNGDAAHIFSVPESVLDLTQLDTIGNYFLQVSQQQLNEAVLQLYHRMQAAGFWPDQMCFVHALHTCVQFVFFLLWTGYADANCEEKFFDARKAQGGGRMVVCLGCVVLQFTFQCLLFHGIIQGNTWRLVLSLQLILPLFQSCQA